MAFAEQYTLQLLSWVQTRWLTAGELVRCPREGNSHAWKWFLLGSWQRDFKSVICLLQHKPTIVPSCDVCVPRSRRWSKDASSSFPSSSFSGAPPATWARNISFPGICGYQEIRNCTSPNSSLQSNLHATLWEAALPFDYRAFVGRSHGQLFSVEYNVGLGIRKEGGDSGYGRGKLSWEGL